VAALIVGLLIGRMLAAPRVQAAPEAQYVVAALEVAWEATWERGTPPPATIADQDQRMCWRVEAFDYGELEAWRCLARDGTPVWAWYPIEDKAR